MTSSPIGPPSETVCPMCDEPVVPLTGALMQFDDVAPDPLWVDGEPRSTHRTCMLREVIGGIGHLIAHDYWCTQQGDPDAGLTRRQSALLVDAFIAIVGIDEAARR